MIFKASLHDTHREQNTNLERCPMIQRRFRPRSFTNSKKILSSVLKKNKTFGDKQQSLTKDRYDLLNRQKRNATNAPMCRESVKSAKKWARVRVFRVRVWTRYSTNFFQIVQQAVPLKGAGMSVRSSMHSFLIFCQAKSNDNFGDTVIFVMKKFNLNRHWFLFLPPFPGPARTFQHRQSILEILGHPKAAWNHYFRSR